jgi:hypothetical protein
VAKEKPTLTPEELLQKLTAGNPPPGSAQQRATELLESGNSIATVTDYLNTYEDRPRGGTPDAAAKRATSERGRQL